MDRAPRGRVIEQPPDLNVVILYNDVPAGQHAMRVLAAAGEHLGQDVIPRLWKLGLLEHPEGFSSILADAVAADILILSTSATDHLGSSFDEWFAAFLARKFGTNAAIVALLGPPGKSDAPDSARMKFLREAAREAGLDFFAPQPAGTGQPPGRRVEDTAWNASAAVRASSFRHWGINE